MQKTLIWLHGLGATADDFADLPHALGLSQHDDWHFIFPQAPMQAVTLNNGHQMPAWYDIYDLQDRSHEDYDGLCATRDMIMSLAESHTKRTSDFQDIILGGFSQGGAVSLFTGLSSNKPFGALIALSAYLPCAQTLDLSQTITTPIFTAHGNQDSIVAEAYSTASMATLAAQARNYTAHTYRMAHTVIPEEIADLQQWIAQLD